MVYYDPRRPKPWPIRLAMKLGAKSDTQAQMMVLITVLLLIGLTIYLYANIFSEPEVEEIDPRILQEMEAGL